MFDFIFFTCNRSLPMFRSTFTPYLKDAAEEMSGINGTQLLVGSSMSFTGFHDENLNLFSCNYLHRGADKFWIVYDIKCFIYLFVSQLVSLYFFLVVLPMLYMLLIFLF